MDEVDSNQLFETAIGAMLKSLDPYTEFENVKQSQAIQESVQGKYGGVGLVIANQQSNEIMRWVTPAMTGEAPRRQRII